MSVRVIAKLLGCAEHGFDRRIASLDSGPNSRAGLWGVCLLLLSLATCSAMFTDAIGPMQGVMLASVLLATKVDVFIARAQRRDLGLCEECGGLNEPETCDSVKCPYNKKQA